MGNDCLMGMGFPFGGMKMFGIKMMVAELYTLKW